MRDGRGGEERISRRVPPQLQTEAEGRSRLEGSNGEKKAEEQRRRRICVGVKEPCGGMTMAETSSLVMAQRERNDNREDEGTKQGTDVPIKDFGMITEDWRGEETRKRRRFPSIGT